MDTQTIYSRFREMAEAYPEQSAIITDGGIVTFSALDLLIDKLRAKIGERDGQFVGIVMPHGVLQIASMLAVLKSGAAYVPAEPALPKNRIDYMMKMAGAELVIDETFAGDLPEVTRPLADLSTADGAAYVLFTSGTSGRPKGVVVENHSVVNYAEAFEAEMRVGPGDVMLQYSICSFDIFVEEVFASLLNGVALAIPSKQVHDGSLKELMDFCDRAGVTILDGFPYLIADLNRHPDLLPEKVSLIISGGDVVRESYISNLRKANVKIYNTYGPSETTVCSNYYRIDNAAAMPDGTFPIGKAVKGVGVAILDDNLMPVASGETGEICITGAGVSRGYLGTPPEQANFVTLPDGSRLYRSGDVGYELPDGNMVFLHRRDKQVMILGRRVEPDEVENVLNEYDGIESGVVRALKDAGGLHFLVAYVVENEKFDLHGLKDWMHSRLADFMVPEYFVSLPHLPLTARGKVDNAALPKILKERTYQ